jgi:hypothetical protein
MNLMQRIESTERTLHTAVQYLITIDQKPGEAAILSTDEQRGLVQELHGHMTARTESVYNEITSLSEAVGHLHNRVSFALRYLPQIWGERAQAAADIICEDLNHTTQLGQLATSFTDAALATDPVQDRQRYERTRASISSLLNESSRFIDGITRSLLTEQEAQDFHNAYLAPAQPKEAYRAETEQLAESYLKIAEIAAARINATRDRASFVFKSLMPAFAEHAKGMQREAGELLLEAYQSEGRILQLLGQARHYAQQAASL